MHAPIVAILRPPIPSTGAGAAVRLIRLAQLSTVPHAAARFSGACIGQFCVALTRLCFRFFLEQMCGLDSELKVPGLAFCLCIKTSNKFQYAFTSKRISLIHGIAYSTL